MAFFIVRLVPVPNCRTFRVVGIVGVFALAPVVDVNVNIRWLASKQTLFFKGPPKNFCVSAAALIFAGPISRVGINKIT